MTNLRPRVSIVGGGIGGLIAALACAERGHPVELFEANGQLGGRARTTERPFPANLGPRALYADGPMWAWLRERHLLPPTARPDLRGFRTIDAGQVRLLHPPLLRAALSLPRTAPLDRDYRSWASERVGERGAAAAIGFVSLPTFDHDPGRLSAAFCHQRFRRLTMRAGSVRYVLGGWAVLVDRLAERARQAGVRIATGSRIERLPGPPVIVAMSLMGASRLLGADLAWHGASTVLLDLSLIGTRRWPASVVDLGANVYATRPSHSDRSLVAGRHGLIQASAGKRPGESIEAATARIETSLDAGFPGWRDAEVGRRRLLVSESSGALDPVGTCWRDRPRVERGSGVYLVGDSVAAPGMLSEVAWASAMQAACRIAGDEPRWTDTR